MLLIQPIIRSFFLSLAFILLSSQSLAVSLSLPKSDDVIGAQINNEISKYSSLSKTNISFSITSGNVSVQGLVNNAGDAQQLIIIIESVPGVVSLNSSNLIVKRSKPKGRDKPLNPDLTINSEVIGTFNREGLMGPRSQAAISYSQSGSNVGGLTGMATYTKPPPPINLMVRTENTVVYLSGFAPDQATADRAVSLAKTIAGVSEVDSSITIGNPGPK